MIGFQLSRQVIRGVLLAAVALCLGCHPNQTDEVGFRSDTVIGDSTISMVITRQTTVRREKIISVPHSSQYTPVSKKRDSWLVQYPVPGSDGGDQTPFVQYLGEAERISHDHGIEKYEGIKPELIRLTPDKHTVVLGGGEIKILKNGKRVPSVAYLKSENAAFTRDRSHVFVWRPEPTIYSLPDMTAKATLERSEGFQLLEKAVRAAPVIVATMITSDRSCLIFVTRNTKTEYLRTKAFCYYIGRDEFETVTLQCDGDSAIHDADLLDGELRWLVHRFNAENGGYTWCIYDSDSNILNECPWPSGYEMRPKWKPSENALYFFTECDFPSVGSGLLSPMKVMRHRLNDGTLEELQLDPDVNLVVP